MSICEAKMDRKGMEQTFLNQVAVRCNVGMSMENMIPRMIKQEDAASKGVDM